MSTAELIYCRDCKAGVASDLMGRCKKGGKASLCMDCTFKRDKRINANLKLKNNNRCACGALITAKSKMCYSVGFIVSHMKRMISHMEDKEL